jgi:2-isopropylmalate synthase
LLIRKTLGITKPLFELDEYHCSFRRTGNGAWDKCEATVKLRVKGEKGLSSSRRATVR